MLPELLGSPSLQDSWQIRGRVIENPQHELEPKRIIRFGDQIISPRWEKQFDEGELSRFPAPRRSGIALIELIQQVIQINILSVTVTGIGRFNPSMRLFFGGNVRRPMVIL